jgi:hypothetical protein
MAEKHSKLHMAAFTIETLAHLQGLERSLLSQAEFVRKVDEALKRVVTEGPTSVVLNDLRILALENHP